MIRRLFKGAAASAALILFMVACEPKGCQKPEISKSKFEIRVGQTLKIGPGDVFSGQCGRNCVNSFRVVGSPSFIEAREEGGGIILDATSMSRDDREAAVTSGRLRDNMSVEINTKCGSLTANLAIDVFGPPRVVRRPSAPEVLEAAPAVVVSGPAPAGASPVSFTDVDLDTH